MTPTLPAVAAVEIISSTEFDSEDRLDFWTDGHIEPDLFIQAIREWEGITTTKEKVKHRFVRQVPHNVIDWGDRGFLLQFRDSPARGAKKVTWVAAGDTEEWLDPMEEER